MRFVSLFFFISSLVYADNDFVEKYLDLHKKFFQESCRPGNEPKYYDLLRDFRGDGHYLPTVHDKILDVGTIKTMLPLVLDKVQWIELEAKIL